MGQTMYCPLCGHAGATQRRTPGSFGVEVLIWLLCGVPGLAYSLWLLVPPLAYSVWRLSARYPACGRCGNRAVIPADTPRARQDLAVPAVPPDVPETEAAGNGTTASDQASALIAIAAILLVVVGGVLWATR